MSEVIDRKARILEAARREFGLRGLDGGRTASIAGAAGANKQLIHYYFGSKEGLYEAVLRDAGERLREAVRRRRAGGTASERLRGVLDDLYAAAVREPELPGLLAHDLARRADRESPLRDALQAVTADIARIVSEGQGLGYFRDDLDPARAAAQAVVLSVGYLVLETALDHGGGNADRKAWMDGAVDLLGPALTW